VYLKLIMFFQKKERILHKYPVQNRYSYLLYNWNKVKNLKITFDTRYLDMTTPGSVLKVEIFINELQYQ
jgi:hypothetical protein